MLGIKRYSGSSLARVNKYFICIVIPPRRTVVKFLVKMYYLATASNEYLD